MTISISFEPQNKIKHLVIQSNNLTLYFKDYDTLLIVMDFASEIGNDENNPFTYVMSHSDKDTEKELYHQGIDPLYSDEGHYHFEKKDRKPLSEEKISFFFNLLLKSSLLEEKEVTFAMKEYKKQSHPSPKSFSMSNQIMLFCTKEDCYQDKFNKDKPFRMST
ncbi:MULTISPECIES: hypothetical protein [unclassified Legionella]|uniref:hypothetical protein n=1 Tax=unclassified Legionella TaxID=2622702 RepID=UPI0010560BE9|nr:MULTISPECIES: hypothetical protein [unclassified Legionella]MDI9819133.1 hypothetical protein [Legionella sp. PL877]